MPTVRYFWHGFIHSGTTFMYLQYSRPFFHLLPYIWKDVQLAKWIAGQREQPRSGHLLVLSLCGRVNEGVREVTNP